MQGIGIGGNNSDCLPPYGGSGLKSPDGSSINYDYSLPPYGGSGLKCPGVAVMDASSEVSLHTEGVD